MTDTWRKHGRQKEVVGCFSGLDTAIGDYSHTYRHKNRARWQVNQYLGKTPQYKQWLKQT